jgi:hypothetical protein
MPTSVSLLRPALAALAIALVATSASSAPSTTLDVLHQDLVAIKDGLALSPVKASDIVIAQSYAGEQCANGFGLRISAKLTPTGGQEPFAVPTGSAFMVTGVGFASTVSAGQYARFVLRAEGSGIVMGEGALVNSASVAAPLATHVAFPSPVRFTTAAPCVALDGSLASTRLWVYGFLVKDQ